MKSSDTASRNTRLVGTAPHRRPIPGANGISRQQSDATNPGRQVSVRRALATSTLGS